jgi:hypothetical protein
MVVNIGAQAKNARATDDHHGIYEPEPSFGREVANARTPRSNREHRPAGSREPQQVKDYRSISDCNARVYK